MGLDLWVLSLLVAEWKAHQGHDHGSVIEETVHLSSNEGS